MFTRKQYRFLKSFKKELKKKTGKSRQLSLDEMEAFCEKNNKVYPFVLFKVNIDGVNRLLTKKERLDRVNNYLEFIGLKSSICLFDVSYFNISIEGFQNIEEYKLNRGKHWHIIIADCMAFAALVISIISLFLKIPE